MSVTLVIPAYNEEARLAATLELYAATLRQRYDDVEILVVANGCKDRTAQVALEVAQTYPEIRVIDIPDAIGKGGAVLEGFRQARGARIVFADADAATTPESLFALVDALHSHEIVIGSRRLPTSKIAVKQPLMRRVCSCLFAAVVRELFALPYRDTQCGAKALRRDAARQLATVVQETRWAFDVDLLVCARTFEFDVVERPVEWSDSAGSKLRVTSTATEVSRSLWRMKQRHLSATLDVLSTHLQEA